MWEDPIVAEVRRAREMLASLNLQDWERERIRRLSKGMAQRVQFASVLLHDPELVILDEPFYGLDPANMALMRALIQKLAANGKTVLISTHMMNEVQLLCSHVLMIHKGRCVLFGSVQEVRQKFSGTGVIVDSDFPLHEVPFIDQIQAFSGEQRGVLTGNHQILDLMRFAVERGIQVRRMELALVPLEDIFVRLAAGTEMK